MKIPADAAIDRRKLTDYLLRPLPRDDKSAFLARGGFTLATVDHLESEIRRLSAQAPARVDRVRVHGVFYIQRGQIVGPSGKALGVKLVWLRRIDGLFWFVTLVPLSGGKGNP